MSYLDDKCAAYTGSDRSYPPERDQDDDDPLEEALKLKVTITGVGMVTPPAPVKEG